MEKKKKKWFTSDITGDCKTKTIAKSSLKCVTRENEKHFVRSYSPRDVRKQSARVAQNRGYLPKRDPYPTWHVDVNKIDVDKVSYELSEIPTFSKTNQKFSRPYAVILTELRTTLQSTFTSEWPARHFAQTRVREQESAVQLDVRCNVQQMSLSLDVGVRVRSTLVSEERARS